MNERPERLFSDGDAFPPLTQIERMLANIEPEFAELVHLNRPVRHVESGRNKKNEEVTKSE